MAEREGGGGGGEGAEIDRGLLCFRKLRLRVAENSFKIRKNQSRGHVVGGQKCEEGPKTLERLID